jgi:hypothetical protein
MTMTVIASYLFVAFVILGIGAYMEEDKFYWIAFLWPVALVYFIPALMGYHLAKAFCEYRERKKDEKRKKGKKLKKDKQHE